MLSFNRLDFSYFRHQARRLEFKPFHFIHLGQSGRAFFFFLFVFSFFWRHLGSTAHVFIKENAQWPSPLVENSKSTGSCFHTFHTRRDNRVTSPHTWTYPIDRPVSPYLAWLLPSFLPSSYFKLLGLSSLKLRPWSITLLSVACAATSASPKSSFTAPNAAPASNTRTLLRPLHSHSHLFIIYTMIAFTLVLYFNPIILNS